MYQQVLDFWFEEIEPAYWWKKDDAFDELLVERKLEVLESVARGSLWRQGIDSVRMMFD